MTSHRVPLGDTGWWVWRDVLLRTAGFPAAGLDRFAAPEAAAAADAMLAEGGDRAVFDQAFDAVVRASAAAASEIAADPLLREAVTWQNPGMLVALDGLVSGRPDDPRNQRRREREKALLLYWQRYCGKSETIGFFGPVCWASAAETSPSTELRPGPEVVAHRKVIFEAWALAAYADRIGEELAVRRWWAPVLPPPLLVDGRELIRPLQPPTRLSPPDAAALAACDGRTPAWQVVRALLADSALGLRSEQDGYLLLDRLVERELLSWDAGLPLSPDAEQVLRTRIAAIGDDAVRQRAAEGFDRLCAARDAVADAAGDPEKLGLAMAELNREFTDCTGHASQRHGGQMYVGRTVVYEETTRDVELVLGRAVLDELAAPLAIVLQAARWLTAEFGTACERVLADLYDELRGPTPLSLSDLWRLAQGLLFSVEDSPTRTVAAEFTARWSQLFGLESLPDGQTELQLSSVDLAARAAKVFAADGPGWPSARVHSPDIQICASSVEAINRGEFRLVLGEMHPATAPFDSAVFTPWHPDQAALRAALDADFGPGRVRLLYPEGFPRQTTRTRYWLDSPRDCQLGVDNARGADLDRLVSMTAVTVQESGGELVAVLPDGRSWPLIEVFGHLLGVQLLDSFKLLAPAPHTPRITIDRLVVARRTWRTTVGETGLTEVTDERERFLAVRRWRQQLGLPEQLFLKVSTETKPCYLDLRSPLYAAVLCTMLRRAAKTGDDVSVVISELLPGSEDAWLTDAQGRGYVSELRFQITDPETHRTSGELA
ncbi:lantibiotic dehydratase [Micromonospora sp. NPDC003197]